MSYFTSRPTVVSIVWPGRVTVVRVHPCCGDDLATHLLSNVSRYFLVHAHLLEEFHLKLSGLYCQLPIQRFPVIHVVPELHPFIHHSPVHHLCIIIMRTRICTLHRIDDTGGVNRAAFFRCWSEYDADRVWTARGGTLHETCPRVSFLSPPPAIFAACFRDCACPPRYPFSFCLRHAPCQNLRRLASEVSSSNVSALTRLSSVTGKSSATLPPAASVSLSAPPPSILLDACVFELSRRSSLTLSTSLSRINCSGLCRQSSVSLLASVPDAAASQPLQFSDQPNFSETPLVILNSRNLNS